MVPHYHGQLGFTDSVNGLPVRVHQHTSTLCTSTTNPCSFGPRSSDCTRGDFLTERKESHHCSPTYSKSGVHFHLFPGSKEVWGVASNNQSSATQCLHKTKKIQDGDTIYSSSVITEGMVGHLHRFEGCLSPCGISLFYVSIG